MRVFAIIPAGGKGKRSGSAVPKQYLKFNGKELIVFTLEVFQRNDLVDEIIVACAPEYLSHLEKLKKKYNLSKLSHIVEGGKERQDSVYNGLNSIKAGKNDLVAVHDAARPLLPDNVLTNALNLAKEKGSALVSLKARDTLVKGKKKVDSYLNREEVYYIQTPQVFRYPVLKKAMDQAYKDNFYGTDESMLVKRINKPIQLAEGSFLNFKITTNEEINLFRKLAKKL